MIYATVCSGIDAPAVAWKPLGWQQAFSSDIEPFPNAVRAHHDPDVPNYGDMTKFREWPDHDLGLVCAGTPCQAFSVAGLRKGLDDPRGNLTLVFLGILDRYRPEWVVWENVPGVLSIDGGRVFGTFLGGLGQLGYGFAYRVLDAQYFGVPQRRRRVFVVGHLGDWRRAAAVLFERHSLQGHPAPRREAGQSVANCLTDRADRGGTNSEGQRLIPTPHAAISPALKARDYKGASSDGDGDGAILVPMVAPTLRAGGNRTGGDRPPGTDVDTCDSLVVTHSRRGEGFGASEDGTGRGTPLVPVAFAFKPGQSEAAGGTLVTEEFAPTLQAQNNGSTAVPAIQTAAQVRRLTPRECERLQGFPSSREQLTIAICLDRQNNSADVALSCLRWPSNASRADAERYPPSASVVANGLSTNPASQEPLAALRVRTNSADELLEIHSRGRLIWSASNAETSSKFPQPIQGDSIAAAVARPSRDLAQAIRAGKAGSRQSIRLSFPALNGGKSAPKSGDESAAFVSDATNDARPDRFTTSTLGALAPTCGLPIATLLCSVLDAIGGCIPSETLPDSFSLEIDLETPYTLITVRGKPAADGPRYKALGNSMAVPVMRWIGERVQMVEDLMESAEVAA